MLWLMLLLESNVIPAMSYNQVKQLNLKTI